MTQSSPPSSSDSLERRLQKLAPSDGSSRAFLLVLEGPRAGRLHLLDGQDMLIGRSDDVDINLSDSATSHRHARVTRRPDGYYLVDLGSRNGTLLNGVLITERKLRKRDQIQIGETTLVFLEEGATESTRTVALSREAVQTGLQPEGGAGLAAGAAAGGLASVPQFETENPLLEIIRKVVAIWRLIRRNLWVLIPLPVLGAAAGVASVKLRPAPEAAAATVKLSHVQDVTPVQQVMGRASAQVFFENPQKNFRSEELVKSVLLELDVPADDAAVGKAMGGLKIEGKPGGEYEATFAQPRKPAPAYSTVGFLEHYLEAYLTHEVDKSIRALKAEAGFLEDELQDLDSELADVEDELLDYSRKNLESLPGQAGAAYSGKAALEQQKTNLEMDIERLRIQARSARAQLKETSSVLSRRFEDLRPLRADLEQKQRDRAQMIAKGMTHNHPDVRKLDAEIDTLQKELDRSLNAEVSELELMTDPQQQALNSSLRDYESQLKVAEAALGTVRSQLGSYAGRVAQVPEVTANLDRLNLRKSSIQRLRGQMFGEYRTKMLQLDLERANLRSRYEMISEPAIQQGAARAALIKRVAMGIAAGLLIAILVVAVLELKRLLARHPELLSA